MIKDYDVEAIFVFIGRKRGKQIYSGYRPAHKTINGELTTGIHTYTSEEISDVKYGKISFMFPALFLHSLSEGQCLSFYEGKVKAGYAIITNIYNSQLKAPGDV